MLQARQLRIETDLANKRAELARVQDELRRERIRLARLRARLAESRAALSDRLVELYKADEPDVVTVILESDGFADLLERAEFMQRVSQQDARIIDRVRTAKEEAVAAEKRLDALEERQRKVTAEVARRAAEVDAIKDRLVDRQQEIQGARAVKTRALDTTRAQRQDLEGDLRALEKEQAAVLAKLQSAQGGGSAGPIRQGSGTLIWPVNGPVVSPFGMRWGRLHAGVDIAVPAGHADPRRRLRPRRAAGLDRRLRQLHVRRARRLALHLLRAPVALRDLDGGEREQGPGDRLRRLHRPLLRRPPALRDARERVAGRPAGLPLAAAYHVDPCSPRSSSAR